MISILLLSSIVAIAILQGTGILILTDLGFPCSFRTITGYYCPGCGGTHAVCALAAGNLITCAREHSFVLYTALGMLIYFLWNTLCPLFNRLQYARLQYKRTQSKALRPSVHLIPVMHFYTAYIYIGIAIAMLQWIIKNMLIIIVG